MNPYKDIISATNRAKNAKPESYKADYNTHPLAACVSNYTSMIDAENATKEPDYLFIIYCLDMMAKFINKYTGIIDDAASYWLNEFLKRSRVADWDKLKGLS